MLRVDDIEAIRRAYYHDHKSVRTIARELHHGRRVVREAIAGVTVHPRQYHLTKRKVRPVLDPMVTRIDAWLEADQGAPPKQRHTAKRIYDRLVAECGFVGHETVIRGYVHAWQQAHHGATRQFLPLAHAPGSEAQCDWGEAVVRVADRLTLLPSPQLLPQTLRLRLSHHTTGVLSRGTRRRLHCSGRRAPAHCL